MIGIGKNLFKANVKAGGVAPNYDADALAYFTANTSITSAADKNAINTFYLGLKSDGIYTKMKAMYLPIWGSAASSKWNLINPLDLNAAFRLTFTTGWTFSSGGMLPNGTSAFADTFFIPAVNGTLNSSHISFYSRTNTDGIFADFAGANLSPNGATILYIKSSNVLYGTIDLYPNTTPDYIQGANTDARGFYCLSRTASNLSKAFKNNSILATQTNSGNRTSSKLLISTNNSTQYSNRQCAFASIGDGLTDTQASNFYSRVNTLMTYFGINV
jgi:hypothetical protein